MFVKICGITRVEDALAAAELGVRAIGLNFYPKSKRYLPLDRAVEICDQLPGQVLKVGLFVNAAPDEVNRADGRLELDLIQFHGDETPQFCAQWGDRVIRAFRPANEKQLEGIRDYHFARMILMDACVAGQYGGTGATCNWELAVKAKAYALPVLLAGGLTPDNVGEAIRAARPFGVDVAGGVETSPGVKSAEKMRRFMRAVRSAMRD